MRHARPSKQCCWLGSSRYRGRCGDAITNAYCDTNTYAHPNGDSDANGYGHGQCYTNSHSNGYG
jgi:hypothetical protein